MPRITDLAIGNVRCFGPTQDAHLGRITLLVGENSVGKSTFLACYNVFANLSNLVDLTDENPFDLYPFRMGGFETIARSGSATFQLGGQFDDHMHSKARFLFGRDNQGEPFEEEVEFTFASTDSVSSSIKMTIAGGPTREEKYVTYQGPYFSFGMEWSEISYLPMSSWLSRNVRHGFLPYNADRATFTKRRGPQIVSSDIDRFGKFINFFRSEMPLPRSRCFDVLALEPDVPFRQRAYQEPPIYLLEERERERINRFGAKLGLWDSILLEKRSGDGSTEVSVRMGASSYNLLDVGYGIHSLLPLVAAIANADAPRIFLLQEPEVHVHPVAQASLALQMAKGPHDFIIETHSDHLVDRFRLCVRQGILKPEELVILYFEMGKGGNESRIFNISVDLEGNILDAPDSYRDFFLTETERLLGLT